MTSSRGNLGQPPHNPDLSLHWQQHEGLLVDTHTFRLPNGAGTKMFTDHELKVTNFKIPAWRGPRPTEKLDHSALANPEVAQCFRAMAEEERAANGLPPRRGRGQALEGSTLACNLTVPVI
jgi:hypothetical protein